MTVTEKLAHAAERKAFETMLDSHQQVLGEDFEPIPGLFATGNCSGGRFGFQYTTSLPGQSISMAQTLGREAGRWIAAL